MNELLCQVLVDLEILSAEAQAVADADEVGAFRTHALGMLSGLDQAKRSLERHAELLDAARMVTDTDAKADVYVGAGLTSEKDFILHVQLGGRSYRIQLSDELMVKAFNEWGRALEMRK